MMANTITPATTPPTTGPTEVFFSGVACPGKEPSLTQVVEAQESQDSAFSEQVSSAPQGGQAGGSGGHWTQRRNRCLVGS
jgi:hypothetical protein